MSSTVLGAIAQDLLGTAASSVVTRPIRAAAAVPAVVEHIASVIAEQDDVDWQAAKPNERKRYTRMARAALNGLAEAMERGVRTATGG